MPITGSVLRSERFVVSVQGGSLDRNIFQVLFNVSDGSVFVSFPYFRHTNGLVSLVTMPADTREPTLQLEVGGRVSSHLVKYSHHPDGVALFSQDGRVLSTIRKQAVPLSSVDGHLFTLHAQGLDSFGVPRPKDSRDRQPNRKRTRLSFRFGHLTPVAIKAVGRLLSLGALEKMIPSGVVQPRMTTVTPEGVLNHAFVCSAPQDTPGQDRFLLLSCEATPALDKGRSASLVFLGGFDSFDVVNDLSRSCQVLAFSYPVENADELRRRLGSIDFERKRGAAEQAEEVREPRAG